MDQMEILLNARLLVVDDQEMNIRLLEILLKREGFKNVRSTANPHTVVGLYTEFQPDLLLLDLFMPAMDGFAILELLRRRIPRNAFMPVLILTADVTPETRRRALALGAKDFVTKPFDHIEVMLRIWNLLETRFYYLQLQQQNQLLAAQVQRSLLEACPTCGQPLPSRTQAGGAPPSQRGPDDVPEA